MPKCKNANESKPKIICTCDFCKKQARYDGKTTMGPWAYMCEEHYSLYGCKIKGLYTDLMNN